MPTYICSFTYAAIVYGGAAQDFKGGPEKVKPGVAQAGCETGRNANFRKVY